MAKEDPQRTALNRDRELDEQSNLTKNTRSVSLVELSQVVSPANGCPSTGPSGGPVLNDIKTATQVAVGQLNFILDSAARDALATHLADRGLPRMMFINQLNAASPGVPGGGVITHIDTMVTFGTVVILLTDTDESDQLTLYKTSMQNVMDETKASEEFTTRQLYKAGSAVAFSVGTPTH